jgi:hypothetical protein
MAGAALRAAERDFVPARIVVPRSSPLAPLAPALSIGLVSGCLGGVVLGWTVGVGPGGVPFAHQGVRAAAPVCGVTAGITYGSGLTCVLGYRIETGPRAGALLAQARALLPESVAFMRGGGGGGGGAIGRATGVAVRQAAAVAQWEPLLMLLKFAASVRGRLLAGAGAGGPLWLPLRSLSSLRARSWGAKGRRQKR